MVNNSGVEVLSLPKDYKMIIDEIVWNKMLGESNDESFKEFDEVEVELNSIIEENNVNKEQGSKKDISRRT